VLPVNKQEDKYVKISGKKVRYWSGGDKGKNVILIHGIGGSVEIEWLYTFGLFQSTTEYMDSTCRVSVFPIDPKYPTSSRGWLDR
jgi:hypothetical protein